MLGLSRALQYSVHICVLVFQNQFHYVVSCKYTNISIRCGWKSAGKQIYMTTALDTFECHMAFESHLMSYFIVVCTFWAEKPRREEERLDVKPVLISSLAGNEPVRALRSVQCVGVAASLGTAWPHLQQPAVQEASVWGAVFAGVGNTRWRSQTAEAFSCRCARCLVFRLSRLLRVSLQQCGASSPHTDASSGTQLFLTVGLSPKSVNCLTGLKLPYQEEGLKNYCVFTCMIRMPWQEK